MFCNKCGSEISAGSAFCSKCGSAVIGTTTPPPSPQNNAKESTSKVVAASYGFNINEEPGCITITVHKREVPSQPAALFLLGCSTIPLFAILAFAFWFIFAGIETNATASDAKDALFMSGVFGLTIFIILYLLRESRISQIYKKSTVIIDDKNIRINKTKYSRSHICSWSIRWTEFSKGGFVAVGPTSFVAGAQIGNVIGNAAAEKEAKHSYCVTFDYGAKTICAIGGMTEPAANRLMEAIQTCLDRI